MKIGYVLDDGLDKPDGVQQYILSLGRWFESNGHEVRYLVGETKRTDIKHVYSMAKNVSVSFNGNKMTIPLPSSKKRIREVLEKEKFDVIHVQVPYSPFFGEKVILAAGTSTRIIGTFHILPYGPLSSFGTKMLGYVLRRSLKRFDSMFSVSPPAADFAARTFKVLSATSPNTVDIAAFKGPKKTINTGNSKILYLGRLVPRKGAQQLLKSISRLNETGRLPKNSTVDICGDGPMREDLEKYVEKHGLKEKVVFHGFVTHEQKLKLMQNADVAVFPSMAGESFGIVLIEAMAAGSGVVLGGDNPGYRSVIGNIRGSIIHPHHPDKMADELNRILTDKTLRKQIHDAQQKHVKRFDTELVAKKLLHAYLGKTA